MNRFLERLAQGPVICAEGYLFEFERRGYLQAGAFVPEVVLEHPELVAQLHREFVHAGSDVVEAFTYYAHREKLRIIGREDALEEINRQALAHRRRGRARRPARCSPATSATRTSSTRPTRRRTTAVRAMFEEQVGWAVDAGVDFIIGETFSWGEEALIALEVIKETGLPAVITLAIHRAPETREGWTPEDALQAARGRRRGRRRPQLHPRAAHDAAAARARSAPPCDGPARRAAGARTGRRDDEPTFQSLHRPDCDCAPATRPFPTGARPVHLQPLRARRVRRGGRTRSASRYLGVCCGAAPHHIRAVAEALGRTPPASRFSADMSRHAFFGSDARLKDVNRSYAGDL